MNALDTIKRDAVLDFIKSVEDRAAELERIGDNSCEYGITEKWANLFDAFEQLSKEIKEAK